MLACIVFTIFDFVQGDDKAANSHLSGGLAILRNSVANTGLFKRLVKFRGQTDGLDGSSTDLSSRRDNARVASDVGHLGRNLPKIFAHLDFWSSVWSDNDPIFPELTLIEGLSIEPRIFDTDELCFYLRSFRTLETRIHEFLRAAKAKSRRDYVEVAPTIAFLDVKQELITRLRDWHHRLLICHAVSSNALDDEQRMDVRVAILNHDKIRLMLLASRENGSFDYRGFDCAFRHIVLMSKLLMDDKSDHLGLCRVQIFSFTPRVIHPLYITATRCCVVTICEEAIRLLQLVQWTEGAWNSMTMAKMARRKLDERCVSTPEQVR